MIDKRRTQRDLPKINERIRFPEIRVIDSDGSQLGIITPEEALNGTTSLNMYALIKGASILRVHDVKEAKECITLFKSIKNS